MASLSPSDRARGIYVKGVDETVSEDDCIAAFSQFGEIDSVFIRGEHGWAVIQFTSEAEAASAVAGGVTSLGACAVDVQERSRPKVREVRASSNIYLKGIDESTTFEDVSGALSDFGEVIEVDVQGERGFAYAEMDSVESAEAAVGAAPLSVGGLSVSCEMRRSRARGRRTRKKKKSRSKDFTKDVYIKNLNPDDDGLADEIEAVFGQFGPVSRVSIRKFRDFAFVTFEDEESVEVAIASSESITIGGQPIIIEARVGKSNATERTPLVRGPSDGVTLFVMNLPWSTVDDDLKDIFQDYNVVHVEVSLNRDGRSRGHAQVQCGDPGSAQRAIEEMNGFDVEGRDIGVKFYEPRIE
jgi:RNA recognition motif-containing protein